MTRRKAPPRFHVGVDEAGYGPRLGPLVVAAAALEGPADPWRALRAAVARPGEELRDRVLLGDSKEVYTPSRGLARLEEGVLAVLGAADGAPPATVPRLLARVAPEVPVPDLPWARALDAPLPRAADPARVEVLGRRLAEASASAGVRWRLLRARPVPEPEFNAAVARTGNKAHALFGWVAPLLAEAWTMPGPAERVALLDKEGGRDSYLPLLVPAFPRARVVRRGVEGPELSTYVLEQAGVRLAVEVRPRSEAFLPVAVASMLAKYVRELHMEALNAFWTREVPGLRPTAGYPEDADRFLGEIEPARAALGIPRESFVRCR